MDVALLCPLVAGIVKWNAPEPLLTVVVKGTFALTGVAAGKLTRDQVPLAVEWPHGPMPEQEVEQASDFYPRKAWPEVIVTGHALAPAIVFEINGVPRPLRKGAAAVGSDPRESGAPIPLNALYLRDTEGMPVRIGPVAGPAGWRREVDGAFDFSRFNTAPADQRVPNLTSGCTLVLSGLLDAAKPIETRIAPVEPAAYVATSRAPGATGEAVPLKCDTLVIDTDRGVCTLTWRGEVSAPNSADAYLAIDARSNRGPSWAEVLADLGMATWTVAAEEDATLRSLGIEPAAPTRKRPRTRSKANTVAMGPELAALTANVQTAQLEEQLPKPRKRAITMDERMEMPAVTGGAALPFTQPADGSQPVAHVPATEGMEVDDQAGDTLSGLDPNELPAYVQAALRSATAGADSARATLYIDEDKAPPRGPLLDGMPFSNAPGAPPPPSPEPAQRRPGRQRMETTALSEEQVMDLRKQAGAEGALPWQPSDTAPNAASPPAGGSSPRAVGEVAAPAGWPFASAMQPQAPHVRPPNPASPAPMPVFVDPAHGSTVGTDDDAPETPRRGTDDRSAPPAAAIATLPLDRYAAIKAALLDEDVELSDLLAEHDLTERAWRLNERQMAIELARDASGALASRIRLAIDAVRKGPKAEVVDDPDPADDLDAYCMIRAEIEEAKDPKRALEELGLETETWARMRRRWSGRCLADSDLAEDMRRRLAEARRNIRRQA